MSSAHPRLALAQLELRSVQQMLGLLPLQGLTPEDAVFVCIDCEAFEFLQDHITEIGIAVLDTRDIRGTCPGINGQEWFGKMKHAHYRPVENRHLVNRKHFHGCERGFQFGATNWISLFDSCEVLHRVFRDPLSLALAADFSKNLEDQKRNVVLVGHSLSNDKKYLEKLDVYIHKIDNITHSVDTQMLAGSTKRRQVGLQRLLVYFGLETINLHNGGNDAAYTLQALLLMALRDHENSGSVLAGLKESTEKLPPINYTTTSAPHILAGTMVKGGVQSNRDDSSGI